MAKIAMIGAGSLVLRKTPMGDFRAVPADPALAIADRFGKPAEA
jgi:hypothetical protein